MSYQPPPDQLKIYSVDADSSLLLPMFTASGVHAGFPSPAVDYLQERIDLNRLLIRNPSSTFICDCTGDSMVDVFVATTCRLVIDRAEKPCNNDLVLVTIDGGFIVRLLEDIKGKPRRLLPQNRRKNYPCVAITEETNCEFWGVVTHILIDPRVRHFHDRFS